MVLVFHGVLRVLAGDCVCVILWFGGILQVSNAGLARCNVEAFFAALQ